MVAGPVAGAEVLVGGVVEHTPADASNMLTISNSIVLNPAVPQGMLLPLHPGVEGLGGEHMAVLLRDQHTLLHIGGDALLRLDTGIVTGVGEIVVGVHILQQVALLDEPDTGGGTAGV